MFSECIGKEQWPEMGFQPFNPLGDKLFECDWPFCGVSA